MKILSLLYLLIFSISAYGVSLQKEIEFDRACETGTQYVISAVGDILLHSPLQKKAVQESDFKVLWQDFIPFFEQVDIAYANLEGPTAYGVNKQGRDTDDPGHVFDDNVYSSYPMFNYHPSLVDDLIGSGIDVVSTANNHSLDRRSLGIIRTIEKLEEVGLPFSGTRKTADEDREWFTITEQGSLSVLWIACTYSTNGIPDSKKQVLNCFKEQDRKTIKNIITEQKNLVDAVIVTPHWGVEYQTHPNQRQQLFAKEMLDAGALAIIGNHPHVVQPMEKYITRDNRETFILYSLGNFVSNQGSVSKRSTIVLFLGLTKNRYGVHLNGVKFLPAYMNNRSGRELMELRVLDENTSYGSEGLAHLLSIFNRKYMLAADTTEVVTNDDCPVQPWNYSLNYN